MARRYYGPAMSNPRPTLGMGYKKAAPFNPAVRQGNLQNKVMGLGAGNLGDSKYARHMQNQTFERMENIRKFDKRAAMRGQRTAGLNEARRASAASAIERGRAGMSSERLLAGVNAGLQRHSITPMRPRPMLALPAGRNGVNLPAILETKGALGTGSSAGSHLPARLPVRGALGTGSSAGGHLPAQMSVRGALGAGPSAGYAHPVTMGATRNRPVISAASHNSGIDLSKYAISESDFAAKEASKGKGLIASGLEKFGKMSTGSKIGLGVAAAVAAGVVMNRRDKGVRPAGPGRY